MPRLPLPGDADPPLTSSALWRLDAAYLRRGCRLVAGVDEAGRGALAGPVVAAAVVMPHGPELAGVTDSKALDPPRRWALYRRIRAAAQAVGIGIVEAEVVDQVNVLRATHLAMALALKRLRPAADFALVDGLPVKGLSVPHEAVVKGDRLSYCIAAASIIAKVTRDHLMADLDAVYPGYGFAEHKGYGTPTHRQVLAERGACPIHRRSFAPVAVGLAPRLPGL